jgi:hypothetical protein
LADDGTLAPDPPRMARAHRAGLRPTSPWLWPAATCLGLGLVLHVTGEARVAAWREVWAAGFAGAPPAELGRWLVGELTTLLAWTLGLAAAVAVLTGAIGPVDASAGERLRVPRLRSVRAGCWRSWCRCVAVGLIVGVCAGAARSVDASASGSTQLWLAWLRYLLFGTGGLLLVAGLVDRALARRRLWRALHRSVAEVRAERRA